MENLYEMIFKRKSFRKFDKSLSISTVELENIKERISSLQSLYPDINVKWEVVPITETSYKQGEYCILIYSEEKENYLLNIGYMFQELDLYLASINVGSCWHGIGKPKRKYHSNLEYIIMMVIGKVNELDFRSENTKIKRKNVSDVWYGALTDVGEVVRYAPSACNGQPWYVEVDDETIKVFRIKKVKSILLTLIGKKAQFYNKIDLGIFLLLLEIVLNKKGYIFEREIYPEIDVQELIPIASYTYQKK